ncbi:PPOX class F420-dependent oxidoreductase [Pseudonocardia sp. TMWB2A]|uniref:PPOX class F420-dependent oxidoreductase n=1 Tax=Pseudonocardia sp. TMWB2A TaxID=687430 RepID=UPI00307F6235
MSAPPPLPDDLVDLLRRASPCWVATTMPDGSPQLAQTWCDTDGEHILINTVETHQKARNLARDPRVSVAVADPDQPMRYISVRGRCVAATTDGAAEHIDQLSQKYLGRPYPGFGGGAGTRLLLTIVVDRIVHPGG